MTNKPDNSQDTYWKSPAQRAGFDGTPPPPSGVSRRGFLEAAGFTLSVAAIGGCGRAPQQQTIPFANQPEGVRAGRMRQFASTCFACPASCGLLVGVRDGRPLKMEGMPEHPLSRGGLCAVGQAQPLALYDSHRLTGPAEQGEAADWESIDTQIVDEVERIKQQGGKVRVVTPPISSPTLTRTIGRFLEQFSDGRHVVFDSGSVGAILDAHQGTHGTRLLPRYRFDRAKQIVSFEADFLGNWISPVEHTAAWTQAHSLPSRPHEHHGGDEHHSGTAAIGADEATADDGAGQDDAGQDDAGQDDAGQDDEAHRPAAGEDVAQPAGPAEMSYHVQLEGRMTLTGSNADRRIRLHPSEAGAVLAHLLHRVAALAGENMQTPLAESPLEAEELDALAAGLWRHKGESIVVSGSNNAAEQILVNHLNERLGNYGQTIDVAHPSRQRQSSDADLSELAAELRVGEVSALIVWGVDLTYYLPELADTIESTSLTVSLAERQDDFASRARFICPDHHPLESWLDAEPVAGLFGICQPTIHPLGDTRSVLESFSIWAGRKSAALDLLKDTWKERVFPLQQRHGEFVPFWDEAVHDGFAQIESPALEVAYRGEEPSIPQRDGEGLTVVVHPAQAIPDSRHAHNPWLQELPDPITKVTWDNYASVSPRLADEQGLADHDVVLLEASGGVRLELPVFIQPGQHDRLVAVSLGYGVPGTDRFTKVGPQWLEAGPVVGANGLVGASTSPLLKLTDGALQFAREAVRLEKTGRRHTLATTQLHDSIELPPGVAPRGGESRQALVQETTLAEFNQDPAAGAPHAHHFDGELWPEDHPYDARRWGMAIDLNRCTGCSACLIACQSENNVPVVGRDEVRRHREMHWIRIDRYYSGGEDVPQVVHQPMMCQHCANAPCETVCPVLATVHSSEGLNQQVYNRCVGTRYCANNCPYKVRRFNWFDYAHDDTLQNLALNPDVTVRMRGIMEKCSMCVQRIQEGKIEAKRLGRELDDGVVQTACQQSCPADAITFGDLNDPESSVSLAAGDARNFRVLEELNVQPQVSYLRKVRNESET